MNITWHGHACFTVESGGYRICLDPYTGVDGYPELALQAHRCLCSHGHSDHSYLQAVTLLPTGTSPFTVQTLKTFHDNASGRLRGENTVHILCAEGLRIAHLGDLGHPLSDQQLAVLGRLDAALIPVGGTYTLDPRQAKQAAAALGARVILPMHYRTGEYGYGNIADLEEFLALWDPAFVQRYPSATLKLTDKTPPQVAALTF